MAEPLDPTIYDPRLYYPTPADAAASGYGSPIDKKFNEWLRSATPGDIFDWYAETGIPTQKGTTTRYGGLDSQGRPIAETLLSAEYTNWRETIGNTAGMDYDKAFQSSVDKLKAVGYAEDLARYLVSKKLGGSGYGDFGSFGDGTGGDGGDDGDGGSSGSGKFGPGSAGYDERKSAYDLLFQQFSLYGMGALVEPLKKLITEGISPSEFTLRLRDTDAYKKRFAANTQRIQKGLRALSEAEYIGLEDQYQDVMRRYGLPESYYTRGDMGRQEGFEKFIAGDVSPVELEDRIQTAQNRVVNAAPEVSRALREFYPDITNGDILAYALDPSKAIENIKRKVTAAEIGAGAMQSGLATGLARAEELQRYGVTGDQARQGYQAIGSLLPRASTLGDIYSKQGMGAYTQTTAEAEIFGTPGAIEAEKKRRQLAQLETASFSGSSGAAGGALARERAGSF